METHTQQILERYRKKFSYANFTWNGDNTTGVKCAKKSRKKIEEFFKSELSTLENAVREQTLKEVIDLLPEIDDGIHPATGMPEYLEINKGITRGRNECRELILSSIKSLQALSSK